MKHPSMMLENGVIYQNHAAIGPMSEEVYLLFKEDYKGTAIRGEASLDIDLLASTWNSIRHRFSRLINGSPDGVVITTNTASGLHLVADGMSHKFEKGQNIIITDMEFTTNSFVWQQLVKRYNMELRVIEYNAPLSRWLEMVDQKTILVAISFVQFSNGFRVDLAMIANLVHEYSGYIVVDAIQGLGAVPFDIKKNNVDFIASGGYKWLMGPVGSGYFYVKPDLLEEMESVLVGWFSDRNFHSNMTHHPYTPWDDARRFQQSLSPHLRSLDKSLEIINDLNPTNTFDHILSLQDTLISMLNSSNYKLKSHLEPQHRSGILKFDHPHSKKIVDQLKKDNIIVAYRDGGIRVSPHYHNTIEDTENLGHALLDLDSNSP